jgi:uncharacterized LabA/DUF88 family protein
MVKNAESQSSLAVLIDADNAQPGVIKELLAEVAKYGIASVKRIYGDWTTPQLGSWKGVLLEHSIQPIQQFRYTTGKNATDSAMIIDAMDLLYTDTFDGFCLVSSDSDFTRLASRIREKGKRVYGFGQKKTPKPFVVACDKFIYTEVLSEDSQPGSAIKARNTRELKSDKELIGILKAAIEATSDESGWAHLGSVGQYIISKTPDFDSRNYGFRKLVDLVAGLGLFEIDRKEKVVLVRDGEKKP